MGGVLTNIGRQGTHAPAQRVVSRHTTANTASNTKTKTNTNTNTNTNNNNNNNNNNKTTTSSSNTIWPNT